MNKKELKEYIGKFGKISGGKEGFEKTLFGILVDVDVKGAVYFKDNDGYGHFFTPNQISDFVEQEFKDKSK